jgi:hypothetical protein
MDHPTHRNYLGFVPRNGRVDELWPLERPHILHMFVDGFPNLHDVPRFRFVAVMQQLKRTRNGEGAMYASMSEIARLRAMSERSLAASDAKHLLLQFLSTDIATI